VRLRDGRVCIVKKYYGRTGAGQQARPPCYWRSLTPLLASDGSVPERRLNAWLLVLEAKKIPHVFFPNRGHPVLYVPPLYEGVALHEILAFESEQSIPIFAPPVRDNAAGVLFFISLLVIWHGLRWHWFTLQLPSPPFPPAAKDWVELFALDVYRTRTLHEWWRTLTALTLHADTPHLASNAVFGLLFFLLLCRRTGLGLGIALTLAASVLGNVGNAVTREAHVTSLGFSTALFAAIGSLCAFAAADALRHHLRFAHTASSAEASAGIVTAAALRTLLRRLSLPLASGMALLGILGGGGEARTDYAAHIWGFCSGLLCAVGALPVERALFKLSAAKQMLAQTALFSASLAAVVCAWCYATLMR
jgi:membrane associated rhomboid family serine protease